MRWPVIGRVRFPAPCHRCKQWQCICEDMPWCARTFLLCTVLLAGCGLNYQHWIAPSPIPVWMNSDVSECWQHGVAAAEASMNALVRDSGGKRDVVKVQLIEPDAVLSAGHILIVEGPLESHKTPEGAIVDEAGWAQTLIVGGRILGAKLTLSNEHCRESSRHRIAAHELGHALGLPHRQDPQENTMHPVAYGGLFSWHADDLLHIMNNQKLR